MKSPDYIVKLMSLSPVEHDMEWLREALQAAVELEFFTIPPYLTALWSIKDDDNDRIGRSIREITQEEMAHMAAACNLLVAIGTKPRISTEDVIPHYPNPMPGGVKRGLKVSLGPLTKEALKTFAEIEEPEEHLKHTSHGGEFCSIGEFYHAIEAAFIRNKPRIRLEGQIAGPLARLVVQSLDDVRKVIKLIRDQGEGSEKGPEDTSQDHEDSGEVDLAHYFRFMEAQKGREYVKDPLTGKWDYKGERLTMPEIWPVEIPPGGYKKDQVPEEVRGLLVRFEKKYTSLLGALQTAWDEGDQGAIWKANELMFSLRDTAKQLMQTPIHGNEEKTYGPSFHLRP